MTYYNSVDDICVHCRLMWHNRFYFWNLKINFKLFYNSLYSYMQTWHKIKFYTNKVCCFRHILLEIIKFNVSKYFSLYQNKIRSKDRNSKHTVGGVTSLKYHKWPKNQLKTLSRLFVYFFGKIHYQFNYNFHHWDSQLLVWKLFFDNNTL